MAKKKSQGRRVYFSALRVHRICYHEPETDRVRKLSPKSISNYQKQLKYLQRYMEQEFQIKNSLDKGAIIPVGI